MKHRRRLHMQLTPLLDLLLIVIFAQYLDVAEREVTTIDEARQALQQRDMLAGELSRLQVDHQQARDRLAQLQALAAQLQEQNAELSQQAAQTTEDLQRAIAQQQLFGDLVSELFDVPQETLDAALTPPGASAPADPAQVELLEQRFRELSLQNAGRMIRHLLSFEEMRKRTDLWQVHIDDTGWITVHAADQTEGFRARTSEEFSERLYAVYKSLPQPKSLVVIMLSWGDARADVREASLRALPVVTERMRVNAGGFIRFEYAILGFQPPPEEPRR
jgi:hypothetical protein